MAGTRLFQVSIDSEEALALRIVVRTMLAVLSLCLLAQHGVSGDAQWWGIGAGAAFGAAAPRRWGAAIGGAAAAALAVMAVAGGGTPAAALLVLPAAAAGWWLRPRLESAHPVPWSSAMLIGAESEVVIIAALLPTLFAAALLLMPIWLFVSPLLWYLSLPVMLVGGFVGMHVWFGREVHRVLPGRLRGVALGQALPAALLAVALGEPLVLLAMALPGACLWAGHLMAESDSAESEPPPRITVVPERRRAGTFR